MKKLMYIALVAVVALTACTKVDMEEIAPRKKVTFQVAGYAPMTKANTSVWNEFTSFTAKAYLHAEGETQTQNFFGTSGELITPYQSNGSSATESNVSYWGPSHDYYWPKSTNSYINFIAWYDHRGVAPSTATETSLSWNNYTVQSTDNLLFADEAWHYRMNTENSLYANDPVAEGVPMLFHHALAQVAFQAKLKSSAASNDFRTDITIAEFTLEGIHFTGSLSLINKDPEERKTQFWKVGTNYDEGTEANSASAIIGWTPSGSTGSFEDTNSHELSTTATPLVSMRTVLPQSVEGMILTLKYTVKTYRVGSQTPTIVENMTLTDNLDSLVPSITEWMMGHNITYTLEFDPTTDKIVFEPEIEDWGDPIGSGVTVE